jgi:phosphate:Na+ symporter
MQSFLARATSSPLRGALTGALLTAVFQSSSLTTVLCVGFISAGLMNLRQAVGVIVGANVGTTITAQVIAFDMSAIALPLITVGVGCRYLARSSWQKHLGTVFLGIGLVFYGMELMTNATAPLRTYHPFVETMRSLDQAWLGILAGAAFTALVQSSSATTGLVIVLATQSLVSLEAAIALVLGANVGSCITAVVAAWGRSAVARQAAAVHVVFNVSGALVWWLLIDPLMVLTQAVSGDDIARQVANAHTIFNVSNALVALTFSSWLAGLVERLIPILPGRGADERPLFLDQAFLPIPSMALERVRLELNHLGDKAVRAVRLLSKPADAAIEVENLTAIQEHIVDYTRRISREEMTDEEAHLFEVFLVVADSLEAVGVSVDDLLSYEEKLGDRSFLPELKELHVLVTGCLEKAVQSISQPELAREVKGRKESVRALRDEAMRKAMGHLDSSRPGVAGRYRHRSGVVDELRRIYYLASHISKVVLRHAERNQGEDLHSASEEM